MKMKNLFKYALAIMVVFPMFTACDGDFDEVNTNPNDPVEISEDLQLGYIERTLLNQVYDYFASGECAATWPQHISKPIYNDADRYFPRLSALNAFWNTMYASVIADADEMNRLAGEAGNRAVQGAALTLKAIALQTLTDAFGDIPASEANQGDQGNFTPKYDAQRDVYVQIFDMLDAAIAHLNSGAGSIDGGQDLIYGGDTAKWLKFATSIKFRAMMRVSDTDLFDASAIQAMANSGNLITTTADNAFIAFETENAPNANPYYGIVLNGREAEWCMGEALVDHMLAAGDPRLAVYANPNANGDYVGKPAGYINPGLSGYGAGAVSEIGDFYMQYDTPLYFINAAQVNLLLAEAALLHGVSGDPQSFFMDGINASLVQNGLSAGTFTPIYNGYQSIAEQLWVSTYMQGYETWAEWRRTDIPNDLDLAVDPQPGVGSIPTRYTYTNDELSLNGANVGAATANQGGDELTTKVWWDQN